MSGGCRRTVVGCWNWRDSTKGPQTDLPDGQISLIDLGVFTMLALWKTATKRVRAKTDFASLFKRI
jgi:hypothetical protein